MKRKTWQWSRIKSKQRGGKCGRQNLWLGSGVGWEGEGERKKGIKGGLYVPNFMVVPVANIKTMRYVGEVLS